MSKKIIFTDNKNDLLRQYFKDISKYKILSTEELQELIIKAQSGDLESKNKIITSNLRFVVTIAKQFQNKGIPLMDLISEGGIGLSKAVDKFDISKNVPFLSYAVWWIKREIHNSIYWHSKPIRLPISQRLLVLKIIDATNQLITKLNRNPTSLELSNFTGIPINQIDYLSQFYSDPVSVDDYIKGDEDNNQICDVIADTNEISPEEEVNSQFIRTELEKILPKLTIREHDIIIMLYGIGIPKVNKKLICSMYNLTYERIRQLKDSALRKLRTVHRKKLEKLI